MKQPKIDPKSPGQSTVGFSDHHGRVPNLGRNGAGVGRDSSGSFAGAARGGKSPHGEAMVAKHRPKGAAPAPVVTPSNHDGSQQPDGDGDGWL